MRNQVSESNLLVLNLIIRYFFWNANRLEKLLKNRSENIMIFDFCANYKRERHVELFLLLLFIFRWLFVRFCTAVVKLFTRLIISFSLLHFISLGSIGLFLAATESWFIQSSKLRFLFTLRRPSCCWHKRGGTFSAAFYCNLIIILLIF